MPLPTDVVELRPDQVKIDDGSDGKDVIIAAKHWTTRLDASKLAGDERAKWTALVGALQKAGWQLRFPGGLESCDASRDDPSSS